MPILMYRITEEENRRFEETIEYLECLKKSIRKNKASEVMNITAIDGVKPSSTEWVIDEAIKVIQRFTV